MKSTKIITAILLLMALLSVLALSSCGKNDKKVKPDPNKQVVEENSAGDFVTGSDDKEYPDAGEGDARPLRNEEESEARISELEKEVSEKNQRIDLLDDSLAVVKADIERLKGIEGKNTSWIPLLIAVIALGALVWLLIANNDLKDKIVTKKEFTQLGKKIEKIERPENIHVPAYPRGVQVASQNDDSQTREMFAKILERIGISTHANGNQITKKDLEDFIANIYGDFDHKLRLALKSEIGSTQNQTMEFITELENELDILKQDIRGSHTLSEKILARVDAANDDRFLRLRLYFRDVSGDLQKALLAAEKADPGFQGSLSEYVENFSKLVNLEQLSYAPNELNMAYEALQDIFKGRNIAWSFPKPGDAFDPNTMEQHKRVGDQEIIHSVLIPGFEVGEIKRKALVDVG